MDQQSTAHGSILPALRAATGEAHQQLEDAVGIPRRIADPAQYAALLEVFLTFYRPLERRLLALRGWSEFGLDPHARRKTPWLEADLLALGRSDDALADCEELPPSASLSEGFGCLYVLEGATLGGRHITAMLENSATQTTARRFFAGYGLETAPRWREFLAALETHAAAVTDADRDATVRAARETFACLHRWFMRRCPVT